MYLLGRDLDPVPLQPVESVLPSRPRPYEIRAGTTLHSTMLQGYLRHIGFWPDASCLVLFCAALRCPLAQHYWVWIFPLVHLPLRSRTTSPTKLDSFSSSCCSIQPFPWSTVFAPPCSFLPVMVVCFVEQQTSFVPSLPPSN